MINHISTILHKHTLISDQVSKQQVEVILHQLQRVLDAYIEGDIVEFGCYVGTTSLFIRRLLDQQLLGSDGSERAFHVYDSFEGLPPKSTWDTSITGEQFTAGQLAISKKQFLLEFKKAHLQPPIVHKAWFKDLTDTSIPDKIAFAFLDGDFYESIRGSLNLVLPHMTQGSTIVVDDYSREALPGVARAVNEHFRSETITTSHNLAIIQHS
ncbi:class I SAM-dependent methyltransferase [Candidatus Saccharibacteria bacterium]|nr:MAG: class I SAM-dependent methyltransferase [Candidatus Saccharibacteria bacterium]